MMNGNYFLISYAGATRHSYRKKMKINPFITVYRKSNLRYIKALNIVVRNIKFLEKNTGECLSDFWVSKSLLDRTQKALSIKE